MQRRDRLTLNAGSHFATDPATSLHDQRRVKALEEEAAAQVQKPKKKEQAKVLAEAEGEEEGEGDKAGRDVFRF